MEIDFSRRYAVASYPGVAFYIERYALTEEYEGGYLVCADEECDHGLSDMCWAEGDTSLVTDHDRVVAVMIGDDAEHVVAVEDLTPLEDEDYCAGCGQIGCGHG